MLPASNVHITDIFGRISTKTAENQSSDLITFDAVADKYWRFGLFNLRESLYDSSAV